MRAIKAGWLEGVRQVPSKSRGPRRTPLEISLIVIHNISLPPNHFGGRYVDQLFTSVLAPQEHPFFAQIYRLELSAHFFIARTGEITQYVSCLDKAWHAGRSCYRDRKECNEYSVGIELEGCDYCAYTMEQYHALDEVIAALNRHYPETAGRIAGHNEVAPLRKTDPGPYFAWTRYRQV